jgi:hypothetical protein
MSRDNTCRSERHMAIMKEKGPGCNLNGMAYRHLVPKSISAAKRVKDRFCTGRGKRSPQFPVTRRTLLALTCLLLVVLMFGCGAQLPQVEFEVTGSASLVWIVYQNASGEVTLNSVSLPWSYSFTGNKADFVSLSATSSSGILAVVTVTIYEDGSVLQTASNNSGGTAQVSGDL